MGWTGGIVNPPLNELVRDRGLNVMSSHIWLKYRAWRNG
jgi:hypothetical protein